MIFVFFFFQAEDGIRDVAVTGVQTCALPISSRVSLGERARRWGLFLIPEESAPPTELRDLHAFLNDARHQAARLPPREPDGFIRAAVDPYVNALHRALLGRPRSQRATIRPARPGRVR